MEFTTQELHDIEDAIYLHSRQKFKEQEELRAYGAPDLADDCREKADRLENVRNRVVEEIKQHNQLGI